MNAIAAIGGTSVLRAINAYRALVPSAVWVLGLKTPRDLNDQNVRSLEALVEPLMQPYFAAEAQAQVATMSAELTTLLLPTRNADPSRAVNAVSATMWKDVAASLALVEMLDRAHETQPIELVLNDDSNALARTAVAWARARGLPSVTVPARAPLRRPRKPAADRTVVAGERGRKAYRALDVADKRLVTPVSAKLTFAAEAQQRAERRLAGKAALLRVFGWLQSDVVVVFEPAESGRASALECADVTRASYAEFFSAYVLARQSTSNLRLAVVNRPSPDGNMLAAEVAASVGLAAEDYAYSDAEHDIWIAAADIIVSVDSTRSIDAASAGVPAVNLWWPASWYLGPSFAADDGIIDVPPKNLAATLVALATDIDLRTQIATIAGERIVREAVTAAQLPVAVGTELAKLRCESRRTESPTKPDIVIVAPPYTHSSAGLRALYRLCHFINLVGGNASIYPGTQLHPTWNTPRRDTEITDRTIVVYPEIFHQALSAKRVVRWVLNEPGLLGGPKTYDADEMVFYYHPIYRVAAQAATAEVLTDERELQIALVDPELFYNDRSRARLYDCVFIYKGKAIYDRVQPRAIRDAYVIQSGWPASRAETAALLRGCRRLYSFDASSAIVMEAIFCGAQAFIVRDDGELDEILWDTADYARQYYDVSHVERFLRLVHERWTD